MPAAKSSSSGRSKGSGGRASRASAKSSRAPATSASTRAVADSLTGLAEQLVNRVLKPLDAVLLTRERIQETLEEAVERGRITRSDANDLVAELFSRGRQQTDDLLGGLVGATRRARKESVERLVRGADRARRTVGVGPSFPILGYDDLSAGQVQARLGDLEPAELRRVRDYERRHANRKSVLAAIERALD